MRASIDCGSPFFMRSSSSLKKSAISFLVCFSLAGLRDHGPILLMSGPPAGGVASLPCAHAVPVTSVAMTMVARIECLIGPSRFSIRADDTAETRWALPRT